ncbi:MAG TPA: hypothetical protein VKP69_10490, partial [Isosphaeraceae bacterium]|nr:hypothetical protein [Isosphaeraceae bacterium]
VDGGPLTAEEPPPPTPATRRGFRTRLVDLKSLLSKFLLEPKRRPMLTMIVGLLFLLLPLGTLQLDIWRGQQVSPSLLPDAHSVLPSLALFALVFVLALRLPDEFRQEIEGHGRLRRQGDDVYEWGLTYELPEDQEEMAAEGEFDKTLRVWKRDEIDANLMPDRVELAVSIGLALALTLLDDGVGLPIPMGITWVLLSLYELITLAAVISMALIFGDMARAVHRLRSLETSDKRFLRERFLRLMDPESVRRLGTAFIGVVANGLLIFTLLLVARLPWLAMPRWRWNLVLGPQNVIPLGPILFAVGLLFILGYWYYCHRAFRALIQRIKYVKLCRLWDKRQEAIAASQLAASGDDQREEVKEQSDRFEKLRQGILAISEEPWNLVGVRKAQVALSMALATPVVSILLGPWSSVVEKAISSMFGP